MFPNIHRKAPVLESLFKKVTGLFERIRRMAASAVLKNS